MKKLRITVEGKTYDVEVEILGDDPGALTSSPAPGVTRSVSLGTVAPSPSASVQPQGSAPDGAVASPLTGRVVEVAVARGATVKEGDTLLTIEAMKMNTFVYAPRGGTVTEVLVEPGASVEEGQALIAIA